MEKRKVTLSLEKDVVDQAKKQDLNMSKAANKALKERTVLEKLTEDERELRDIIEDARENGAVETLPMRIENLQIESIGKFEQKKFNFSSEDTVILGPNSSGKTTIIRALKAFFGEPDQDLINFQENSGKIEIDTEESSGSMTISKDRPIQGECLVIDNIFSQLSTEKAIEAVQKLREKYTEQIILATQRKELAEEFENKLKLTSINETRLKELKERLSGKKHELNEIKNKYSNLAEEQEKLERKYEDLVSELAKMEDKEVRLNDIREDIEACKESLEEEENSLKSIREEISEAENEREIGKLEAEKEQAKNKVEELKEELEELEAEKSEIEESLDNQDEIEEKLNKIKMKKERKSEKIAQIKEEIGVLMDEKDHIESEIKEVESNL